MVNCQRTLSIEIVHKRGLDMDSYFLFHPLGFMVSLILHDEIKSNLKAMLQNNKNLVG